MSLALKCIDGKNFVFVFKNSKTDFEKFRTEKHEDKMLKNLET